jgi:hypothetical protein
VTNSISLPSSYLRSIPRWYFVSTRTAPFLSFKIYYSPNVLPSTLYSLR